MTDTVMEVEVALDLNAKQCITINYFFRLFNPSGLVSSTLL